ncbi:MAG: DEAD/DEAH box helicase [Actinomycetaceae bacterium]|nr:DEAD/DEAH box helicase [Arcanobacterium sp.]MDD7686450.1 DEAD/DEAH box helicase [Actinomycetaceae bacterium]MDY5272730.1 DEAD/DEAH box helicase [Arcanobacterium sp.]
MRNDDAMSSSRERHESHDNRETAASGECAYRKRCGTSENREPEGREDNSAAHAVIANFIDQQAARGIVLDSVQREALFSLSADRDVLMCAPTGSGKTMVALGAVELAFARSQRCVYTAPIKALSNQKYRELCESYGAEHIGLLTGDETINRDAHIIVATTEVLRNMLYAHDTAVADIGYVVLDEVHYLADPVRGPVWEEIIVQLPAHVRLVSLSATVANADELTAWLRSVRGPTSAVISHKRPVPLIQYVYSNGELTELLTKKGQLSPAARSLFKELDAAERRSQNSGEGYYRGNHSHGAADRYRRRRRTSASSVERRRVISALERAQMLPAIEFIFSRKGCDRAVADLLDSGVSFTSKAHERRIDEALMRLREQLTDADAQTVRFNFWAKALRRGFAAHHAGMFPPLKELTEKLMGEGLLSLVYATGTLALGIDMPVRSVVIEELRRFDGTDFVDLSATEYTQLIGRAGRRGKDAVGYAVVLAGVDLSRQQLLSVATGGSEPLKSAFFPSYNTVINLLQFSDYAAARAIMGTSFAQFQANDQVAHAQVKARRIRGRIAEIETELSGTCERGDIVEYARLRASARRASKAERKRAKADYRIRIERSWKRVESGKVYVCSLGGELEYFGVLSTHDDRIRVVTIDGALRWIRRRDVSSEVRELGVFTVPFGIGAKDPRGRTHIANEIFELAAERIDMGADTDLTSSWDRGATPHDPAVLSHPVHSCPDVATHVASTQELLTLDRQLAQLEKTMSAAADSVAREFDITASILAYVGYLQGVPENPAGAARVYVKLSSGAPMLARIHNESDLLMTLCLRETALSELSAPEFAGICTAFLSDRRLGERVGVLNSASENAWKAIRSNYDFLHQIELQRGIMRTPEPQGGGIVPFTEWASGMSLARILKAHRLDVGDFMTAHRRLIDLLGQIALAVPATAVGELAEQSIHLLKRWEWL